MKEQLRAIEIEDCIWFIYLGIVTANLYSNTLEREYLYTKDKSYYRRFRWINGFVLWIILFIYLFLTYSSLQEKNPKRRLLFTVANVFFIIGTLFTLYAFYRYPSTDEEEIAII